MAQDGTNHANEIGKLKTEIQALKQILADYVAEDVIYYFGDATRHFKARGYIVGGLRQVMNERTKKEETLASLVLFHPIWSGGIHQVDDVPMGKEEGQWWPRLLLDETLKKTIEQIQEQKAQKAVAPPVKTEVKDDTAGARRPAAIARPGAMA